MTAGSSAGLALITDYLCQPGDAVVVEDPTYVGALSLFHTRRLRVLGIPVGPYGADLDHLETIVKRERPRLIYLMPAFQNPTGVSLSESRRSLLAELSRRHDLIVVEDDTFGMLPLQGGPPRAVKDQLPTHTAYVGGLSKALFPGLRVGWLIPPATLHKELLSYQRASILSSPPLLERARRTLS